MAAGNTYTPLATSTLSGAQPSVSFASISGSYTDLVLVASNLTTSINGSNFYFRCGNGTADTGSNYSVTLISGDGTTAASGRQATQTKIIAGGFYAGISNSTSYPAQVVINLMNYANTTTYKTILSRDAIAGSSSGAAEAFVGLWRSTSAINIITVSPDSGNFSTGTFTLYGILAA